MPKLTTMLKSLLVGLSPWLLALLFLGWIVWYANDRIDRAAYAYPREVITYGLAGTQTDEEVINTIQQWKRDSWGAQIGALHVLCKHDRRFIDSLGGGDTGAKICRVAQ